MKILYKSKSESPTFRSLGIDSFIVKHIVCEEDKRFTIKKDHHHTGFEVHMITKGFQSYIFGDNEKKICAGKVIVIPPLTRHRTGKNADNTEKISLCFTARENSPIMSLFKTEGNKIDVFDTGERLIAITEQLLEEKKSRKVFTFEICDALATEILLHIIRLLPIEAPQATGEEFDEDARILMAKQYITDNIDQNPRLSDVASYCYIGEKQLTRLFKMYANITPGAYIQNQKCLRIEKLLSEGLPLKDISDKMNFASEYHFNSFFKKYAGVPPGEYRKMIKRK